MGTEADPSRSSKLEQGARLDLAVAVLSELGGFASRQELARVLGRLTTLVDGERLTIVNSFEVRYALSGGWSSVEMDCVLLTAAGLRLVHEGRDGWSLGPAAQPPAFDREFREAVETAAGPEPIDLAGFTGAVG